MKYAKYLAGHAIPEWQAHYFKYKKLKKELKQLARISESNPSNFGEAQQAYIDLLYEELESVNKFFEDKEKELLEQYSQLKTLLADSWLQGPSKRTFLTFANKTKDKARAPMPNAFTDKSTPSTSTSTASPSSSSTPTAQVESKPQAASDQTPRSRIPFHLSEDTPLSSADSPKRSPIRDSEVPKGFAPHSRKGIPLARRYRFAIKRSIEEVHRGLSMLKDFSALNTMGFRKIIKKHDKVPNFPALTYFLEQEVYTSHLHTSTTADSLMAEVETVYANIFTGGNMRQATDKLRVPNTHHEHDWGSFRFGACVGACIIIVLYLMSVPPGTLTSPPYGDYAMFAFRFLGAPILWLWTFATVMLIWNSVRINYVFIFGWDPRKHITPSNLYEIAAALSVLWLAAFAGYYNSVRREYPLFHINANLYPLIVLGVMVLFLAFPFNAFYRSSRWWMFQTMGRILRTPLLPVKFKDFFYTNQFTSLKYAFSDMGDTLYFYIIAVWSDDTAENRAAWSSHALAYRPTLQAYPALLRLLQCLRRYRDSKDTRHLINTGKYTFSVLTVVASGIRKAFPHSVPVLCIYCIIATISTCYSWLWDVMMDWDLGHPKHKMLRSKLMYSRPWVYYLAAALDLIFRGVWAVTLGTTAHGFNTNPMTTIASITEIVRRFIWNIFRLENEHLKNCLQSNATAIPALIKAYREMNVRKDDSTEHINFTLLTTNNKTANTNDILDTKYLPPYPAAKHMRDYEQEEDDSGDVEETNLDEEDELVNQVPLEGIRHRRITINTTNM